MNRLFWAAVISVVFISCERAVEFDLKQSEPKLVVEATIENDQPPVVVLSRSLNYFSEISPAQLAGSFVHDASVFISNGTQTHQLKEYAIPITRDYNLYYYSIDSAHLSTAFEGKVNTTYSLQIVAGGKEYTATTTIPNITKKIDSLWWKPTQSTKDSSRVTVMVKATDPKGFGDYIRYWTRRNREPYLPGYNSVFDDLFIDGTTYELEVEPGVDRNRHYSEGERFFKRGDTVTFKISNIDKATFDFWRTMEYTYASVGNPFSSPIKVLGNISNGALGYFGGYASQYHTLIIPR